MNEKEIQNFYETIEYEIHKISNNEAYINNSRYFGLSKELLSYIRKLEQALDDIKKICNSIPIENSICDIGKIHDIEVIIQKAKGDVKNENNYV